MTADRPHRASTWLQANGQRLIDCYLFANVAAFVAWQGFGIFRAGHLDLIEISFIVPNLVMAWFILIRHRHVAIDRNHWHQAIALTAFFSGIAFMGQPATADPSAIRISQFVLLIANLLGLVTLCNLGASFGILIACRQVKTGGLYRYLRHPMYATDILLRIGFLVSHRTLLAASLFVLSTACYVWRAILEERFLVTQEPAYRAYMAQVRYRFIPGVF